MTRYRLLEILGTLVVIGGALLGGIGGAVLINNLVSLWLGESVSWATPAWQFIAGIALYALGRAIGKVGERHLQQPVHQQV